MHSELDLEQLRNEVWDEIYRAGPRSVAQLANSRDLEEAVVQSVVGHDWFVIQVDGMVCIAEN
ncbi:hypothetical protein [Aureliella helgolandensis]|uniref:Uncharacterized protein n=1 Tax=Aureliella helgolandensis TaxID=2527968 RepID=A0A518G5A9_9BACT|nr:hypothetical protein [Aureliella helgolandensis]QDV23739.1 hypothetical protein Q31a_20440 [Aureliella helgolandensis]